MTRVLAAAAVALCLGGTACTPQLPRQALTTSQLGTGGLDLEPPVGSDPEPFNPENRVLVPGTDKVMPYPGIHVYRSTWN